MNAGFSTSRYNVGVLAVISSFNIYAALGSKLLTVGSFFEAVEVMDGCNIDVWYKPCIDLLLRGKNLSMVRSNSASSLGSSSSRKSINSGDDTSKVRNYY